MTPDLRDKIKSRSFFDYQKRILRIWFPLFFVFLLPVFWFSCSHKFYTPVLATEPRAIFEKGKPKNIILMIGDGMGLAQICAGKIKAGILHLEKIIHIGLMTTHSIDDYVTDSAAGATAFATGEKTKNGNTGVDERSKPLRNIVEMAAAKSVSTGIVVTCSVTHATPAAFLAHAGSRWDENEIANGIAKSDVSVLIGGGRKSFLNSVDGNLIDKMKQRGYCYRESLTQLYDTAACKRILALLYDHHPPKVSEGRGNYLPEATKFALGFLEKNQNGFFLMVEGSQIDWGGHGKDLSYIIDETVDFDNAVKVVMDFVDKNPETLLLVTADHETGGLALNGGSYEKKTADGQFTTNMHTGIMVPVFAYGKGAEYFQGFYDNTDLGTKMMKLLDLN